ncbi:Hypothetical protein CINCED_3A008077 [Cinara cedri]|uniref:Uncharacterized protein n=1 Tax=Cinara cedri TaxID=506608 RepID=A0A5E4N5W7_9HEMI|nr:Hypothetical protein CINCED_3A008077 [Cinara cedri]
MNYTTTAPVLKENCKPVAGRNYRNNKLSPPSEQDFKELLGTSEWSRHCRLPIFNQEFQPEPVNLQNNNHHRRGGDAAAVQAANRAQEMVVERLERAAHNRVQPVNLQQEDRDHNNRHHA